MAQDAALMMEANNALSHEPPLWWNCYTAEGREAAEKSNLALGIAGAGAIAGYMVDSGDNNRAVGHRRWFLYPPLQEVGTGSTSRANAVMLYKDTFPETRPAAGWVAWPPSHFVPWETIPYDDRARQLFRWSLSSGQYPDADYSDASVTMLYGSESLVVVPEPLESGAGDNTIVWNARRSNGGRFPIERDATFTVRVSGIRHNGGTLEDVVYTVRAVRAVPDTTAPAAGDFDYQTTMGRVGAAKVVWHNSRSEDLRGVELRVRQGTRPPGRSGGTRVCRVTFPVVAPAAKSCLARRLGSGVPQTFAMWSFDHVGNHSARKAFYMNGSTVEASVRPATVKPGGITRISGTLYHNKPAGNTILASEPIRLDARTRRADGTWTRWALAGTATTTAGPTTWGQFSFKRKVNRTTQFRATFAGGTFQIGSRAAHTVTVK